MLRSVRLGCHCLLCNTTQGLRCQFAVGGSPPEGKSTSPGNSPRGNSSAHLANNDGTPGIQRRYTCTPCIPRPPGVPLPVGGAADCRGPLPEPVPMQAQRVYCMVRVSNMLNALVLSDCAPSQAIYDEISGLPPAAYGGSCSPRTMRLVPVAERAVPTSLRALTRACMPVCISAWPPVRRSCFGSTKSRIAGSCPRRTREALSLPRRFWMWSATQRNREKSH
jgi:hypothetical protein